MYTSLSPGAQGIKAEFEEVVRLAAEFGYGGIDPDLRYIRTLSASDRAALPNRLAEQGLRWGSGGAPIDLNADAASFGRQLADLGEAAGVLREAGVERVGTWIRPMHNELTYRRNFAKHVERIALAGEVFAANELRFGLEYVGPKTFWSTELYPFVHTLKEARELIAAVGNPNVGIVLDTFHWFTSSETADDLRTLTNQQIVAADVNDALPGRSADEQIDNERGMPGATGVIDVAGFLGALREIGYDGPVKAEPFIRDLGSPKEAAEKTAQALRSVNL